MTNRPDVAVPALLDALSDPDKGTAKVASVKVEAHFFLRNFGANAEARKAVPILMDMAKEKDPVERGMALGTLAKMRYDTDKIFALFIDVMKSDPDPAIRRGAIGSLGTLGGPAKAAYPMLIMMLEADDGKDAVRTMNLVGAVAALGPHDERYVRALTQVCKLKEKVAYDPIKTVPDCETKNAIDFTLRKLAEVGPAAKSALPTLMALLNTKPEEGSFYHRQALTQAFAAIGPPAVKALSENVKTSPRYPRLRTIRVLEGIGPPAKAALPALEAIAAAARPHTEEWNAARSAVRTIGGSRE
jgi:HEAT repeat protein